MPGLPSLRRCILLPVLREALLLLVFRGFRSKGLKKRQEAQGLAFFQRMAAQSKKPEHAPLAAWAFTPTRTSGNRKTENWRYVSFFGVVPLVVSLVFWGGVKGNEKDNHVFVFFVLGGRRGGPEKDSPIFQFPLRGVFRGSVAIRLFLSVQPYRILLVSFNGNWQHWDKKTLLGVVVVRGMPQNGGCPFGFPWKTTTMRYPLQKGHTHTSVQPGLHRF